MMIDPHADDEAEYAAQLEWWHKVLKARKRLQQARKLHEDR